MVTANAFAGSNLGDVYPHLAPFAEANGLAPMCKMEEVDWSGIDIAFTCLPHAITQQAVVALPSDLKIVDLSADFRLRDADVYEEWYDTPHVAPDHLAEAVYGLCELVPEQIKGARLIANPGCYPTSVQLPLVPLIDAGLLETSASKGGHIVINASSGTSGAGRSTGKGKEHLLYAEASGSYLAYGVGHHRHMPEIEQGLVEANKGEPVDFSFTPCVFLPQRSSACVLLGFCWVFPFSISLTERCSGGCGRHLLPMTRGILATMYVQMKPGVTVEQLHATLTSQYSSSYFVVSKAHAAIPTAT